MKKLLSTLGLICVFAFSVTLFGERQKRYPPAISSATMDAVCKQIRPENFERQFREVLGEPRNVRALTRHSGEGRGGYEWECEFTGPLYTSEWDFPHDETVPAFSLMASNKSTGPNANVLQIVDRGGSYNELAINLLSELCEANGWKYHVHWAPRREERMELNRRRATMRKQYFATQEILDQLQSAEWYGNVDPEWRTLQLVPGKGDSFRPDTWGYEVSRNVYRYGETGRIEHSKATGYHLRVEGGLSRDGITRLRVLNFPAKFNDYLLQDLQAEYDSQGWEYEVLDIRQTSTN